ncbi:hypothetical protein ABZ372_37155, partial [Streptomyces sp. NPDC005921]
PARLAASACALALAATGVTVALAPAGNAAAGLLVFGSKPTDALPERSFSARVLGAFQAANCPLPLPGTFPEGRPRPLFAARTSRAEPVFDPGPGPSEPDSHFQTWSSPAPREADGRVAA